MEEKEDLPKKRHFWIYGPPNSGKTTYKNKNLGNAFEIPKNNDFYGYAGEKVMWIDEFKGQLTIQ